MLFFIQFLSTLGAGTILYGVACFVYWIVEKINEKKEFDEEQREEIIEEAVQRALQEFKEKNLNNVCINQNKYL